MTVLISNQRERSRFLRFAVVGVIGAVVDFGVANLLVIVFHAPLVLAGTISFILAILSNFIWNRYWTYPDSRSKPISQQLIQFFIVSVIGLAIRVPILKFVEPPMESLTARLGLQFLPYLSSKTIGDNLTLALAVIVVMFWNFFVNRYWTYSDVE
ncbi:MAG: GtrA family protein [Anaerolineales bacterium]|jgi:putative flippase GtrA|nr:GtrA family protein [Anaerolineales bacterium]